MATAVADDLSLTLPNLKTPAIGERRRSCLNCKQPGALQGDPVNFRRFRMPVIARLLRQGNVDFKAVNRGLGYLPSLVRFAPQGRNVGPNGGLNLTRPTNPGSSINTKPVSGPTSHRRQGGDVSCRYVFGRQVQAAKSSPPPSACGDDRQYIYKDAPASPRHHHPHH